MRNKFIYHNKYLLIITCHRCKSKAKDKLNPFVADNVINKKKKRYEAYKNFGVGNNNVRHFIRFLLL